MTSMIRKTKMIKLTIYVSLLLSNPVTALFQLSISSVTDVPHCLRYSYLPRGAQRSENNTVLSHSHGKVVCDDHLRQGWYRSYHGEIATNCVPTGHCGTQSTIWMKDPVPDIGETRLNSFCVNHATSSNPNPCCSYSFPLNVTNCGGFMVYYIRPSEILCPSGFCTGGLKACANGHTSPTGFEPCTATFPIFYGATLSSPVLTNDSRGFIQTCLFNYVANETDSLFNVTWMFDSKPYKTVVVPGVAPHTFVSASDWIGHVGQELSCKVVPYFKGKRVHGPPQLSKSYFGGLKIYPTLKSMSEGGTGDLLIQSTLPVVCPHSHETHCKLELDIIVKSGNPNRIRSKSACSTSITTHDWDGHRHLTKANAVISSVIDDVERKKEHFILVYRAVPSTHRHPMWDNVESNELKLTIQDFPTATCMQLGDPVIITRQGRATRLSDPELHLLYQPGDYTMFSADLVDRFSVFTGKKRLEVQTRLWLPKSTQHASSVCAVAVHYDKSLIMIDMCTDSPDTAVPVFSRTGQHQDGIQVFVCNSNYEIVTQEGVRISVITHDYHLDVRVKVSTGLAYQYSGLCSYYVPSNLVMPNLIQYKRMGSTSLFSDGAKAYIKLKKTAPEHTTWCTCGNSSHTCSALGRVDSLHDIFSVDSRGQKILRPECKKATAGVFLTTGSRPTSILATPSMPTAIPGGLAASTSDFCRQTIVNQSSVYCLTHNKHYLDLLVKGCELDYKESNSYDFIQSYVQGFYWSCEEMVWNTLNNNQTNVTETSVMLQVNAGVCPNFCSGVGTCLKGTCSCPQGHFGHDCSLTKQGPLQIIRIAGSNACPLTSSYCSNVPLVVRNLVKTSSLTAMIRLHKFHGGLPQTTNTTFYLPAEFQTRNIVILNVSSLFSQIADTSAFLLDIQISEDDKTFSNSHQYTIYDDTCLYCVSGGPCLQQENACHIDGKCFLSGEKNPNDDSRVCDPTNSVLSWTNVKDANPFSI